MRIRQRRSPCRIHSGDAHAVSLCYDKGVGYFCYFSFLGWAFGDAFVSMNCDKILTPSLYVNFK